MTTHRYYRRRLRARPTVDALATLLAELPS
jgi:hypothetical protein